MTQPYYGQQPVQQPVQQPAMPQYPQQPMMPQYPVPQQQYAYPQQPMFQQPAPAPLVQGTLSDFFNQPSTGGGPVFSWKGKPIGTTYGGIVTRAITQADIQQQTMPGSNVPAYYRDGRPKFLMKVPLTVVPTPEFPDGQAQWWVSGSARDELARAMSEAGCEPNTTPEAGAAIVITLTGERPSGPGMNPSKTYRVQYRRPPGTTQANGAASVQLQQPQPPTQPPAPVPQPVPQPMPQPVQTQATVSLPAQPGQLMHPQPVPGVPMPPQVAMPAQVQQPIPQPAPQPVPAAQPVQQPTQPQPQANELNPAQQQLLAELTGG